MISERMGRTKLDAGLARLLDQAFIHESEKIPVVVISTSSLLDDASQAIRNVGGDIRHILRPLHAVAAWVPFGEVERLSEADAVQELELDQAVSIA